MTSLRPGGSGRVVTGAAFVRATTSPLGALVVGSAQTPPTDWPTVSGADAPDGQLGHALGWTCEVRKSDIVILNPLGEGVYKVPLPELDEAWLHQVRMTESAAVYLLDSDLDGSDPGSAHSALLERVGEVALPAASVRTSIASDFGAMDQVGRNDPCPCGSGRKFKKCHG